MNVTFLGNRPDAYKVHAIVTTYVRLVEGALVHCGQARDQVLRLWTTHTATAIGSHNMASNYFEDCINLMHRATLCMNRMPSNRDVPNDLKTLFPKRPVYVISGMPRTVWLSMTIDFSVGSLRGPVATLGWPSRSRGFK